MIAWVPDVPGDFVTVSDKTGVIRVWYVSNRQPKDTLTAEAGPFQGISFVHGTQRALCRFKSGAVGLCDLSKRTWVMFGKAAHTDTVFNAAFQPADPNMLATCSFDGSVRIWDTKQARLFRDLVGEEVGVLYAISWPPPIQRLVTCSSKGEVPSGTSRRASSRGGCTPRRVRRTTLSTAAIGASATRSSRAGRWWAPWSSAPMALSSRACATQTRRSASRGIQPTRRSSRAPARTASCGCGSTRAERARRMAGRRRRRLVSSGIRKGLRGGLEPPLLTSSCLAPTTPPSAYGTRAIARRACSPATHNVRALHWSYEVPWLCFSGASRHNPRVGHWSCTCLQVLADHHADVYSLVSHPMRPAVLLYFTRHDDSDVVARRYDVCHLAAAHARPQQPPRAQLNSCQAMEAVQPLPAATRTRSSRERLPPQACCGSGGRLLADRLISLSVGGSRLELLTCLLDSCHPPRGMAASGPF